ncbi:MAG: hypothetical protein IT308_00035 [Anaerolineaceae bacterium]|nr:hypothetical protein [Anaerolineaceae bacterium]
MREIVDRAGHLDEPVGKILVVGFEIEGVREPAGGWIGLDGNLAAVGEVEESGDVDGNGRVGGFGFLSGFLGWDQAGRTHQDQKGCQDQQATAFRVLFL